MQLFVQNAAGLGARRFQPVWSQTGRSLRHVRMPTALVVLLMPIIKHLTLNT